MTPILDTERLHLRPLAPRDAEALFAIMSDAAAMRFWDWSPFREVQTVREVVASQLASMQAGEACYWAACLRGTGHAIGTCDLSDIDRHHGRAEVGFAFHRSYWGNGYALEAMTAISDYAFSGMALARLGAPIPEAGQAPVKEPGGEALSGEAVPDEEAAGRAAEPARGGDLSITASAPRRPAHRGRRD